MGFLLLLGGIALIIWFSSRSSNNPPTSNTNDTESQLEARNREWAMFIASYRKVAKTKAEKAFVERMLEDVGKQGLPIPPPDGAVQQPEVSLGYKIQSDESSEAQKDSLATAMPAAVTAPETKSAKAQVQLDNASLLLYFGAFLFVASTGLFVVFGGMSGGIRCFIVLLVSVVLYSTGIWLFKDKPKFQQAGIAFAGIGMAITPLVGLAAYNYLFNQSNGPQVWFVTSVICLAMYLHALFTLRKPLINYVFIFTFLSLFESGVSIINAPIYYFGWMLALVGIVLTLVTRLKNIWPDVQESSRITSAVFIPLAVLVSLAMVGSQGVGQLGVSLLIAAIYYGMEAVLSKQENERIGYALTSHITGTFALAALVYGASHNWQAVSLWLAGAVVAQTLFSLFISRTVPIARNIGSVIVATQAAAVFASVTHAHQLLVMVGIFCAVSLVLWLRQQRSDMYVIGALASLTMPAIFGKLVSATPISNDQLVLLLLIVLVAQFLVTAMAPDKLWPGDKEVPTKVYFVSIATVIATTFLCDPWFMVGICMAIAITAWYLLSEKKDQDWAVVSGLVVAIPMLRGWEVPGAFLATALSAVVVNVFLSLRYRNEVNRWLSTITWLLLPLALGSGILGEKWGAIAYTWAYMVIFIGLVVSRSIARGVLFASSKVPLASYARSASMSYVFGYWVAAILAVAISFWTPNGQVTTTTVLALLTGAVWVITEYIEKDAQLFVLIPILCQAVLISAMRPSTNHVGTMQAYLFISSILAVILYFALPELVTDKDKAHMVKTGALITSFIAPFSVLFVGQTYVYMPIGLLIASGLTYESIQDTSQTNRELTGGLATVAIMWLMYFTGVRQFQAYSHVVVALMAFYAYWRHTRGEEHETDAYLHAMLAIATIPLAIQALGGQAGGLYGWWLLLEQVVFMIIGMAIGKRFVTMWGMYVAIGAVLYQLRNLGWAALTVLALFLIGIAVYKIQKYNDK